MEPDHSLRALDHLIDVFVIDFVSCILLPSRNRIILHDAIQIPARTLSLRMNPMSAAMIRLAPSNSHRISLYPLSLPLMPDLAICAPTSFLPSGPGLTDLIIIRTLRVL